MSGAAGRPPLGGCRLFIGLGLDAPAREAATAALEALRGCVSGPGWRARPVLAADLHATVLFVGEVGATALPAVRGALDAVAAHADARALAGAPLLFDRLEAMPERGAPRLVWLRATEGEHALALLAGLVVEALRAAGVAVAPDPHRAFRGHVTLARLERAPADARALLAGLEAPPARLALDHLALFETLPPPARRTRPGGARYAVLHRVSLRSQGAGLAEAASPTPTALPSVATR